jgi:hypothetical protein
MLRCSVGFCCGSSRDKKPCPLSRQLSPKAAMAAPFPISRRTLPEQGEAGRPTPHRQAGRHAFSGMTLVLVPAAFGSPAGPLRAMAQGSVCLRGTSFAVRLAAPEPGSFPTPAVAVSCRHEHTTTIPSRRPNDPRQHARQRRAVARCVLLAVPPPGDLERRPVARPRAGADIRAAHGLHPVRHRRCRRPAELAGTATAGEPDRGAMAVSGEQCQP